jgi:two-component system, OmpR family, sensor histidine kinase VicK
MSVRRRIPAVAREQRMFLAKLAVVAGVYFGTAKLGLSLAYANSSVTAIWPPTGIALAATLLWGYRIWPGIALGALLANCWTGVPPITVLGITTGNTLEALAGAYLLRRVGFRTSLDRVRDVVALAVLAATASTMISATIGVTSLHIGAGLEWNEVASTWRTWWLGDMGGDLLVAPVLLLLAAGSFKELGRPGHRLALAGWLIGLMVTSTVVFSIDAPIKYLLFPPMVWGALRFQQAGAALSSLIVVAIGTAFTQAGAGPFVQSSIDGALLLTQTFIGVAAITCMLLAAITSGEKQAQAKLQRAHEGLEQMIRERTDELERSNAELALQGEIAANMAEGVVLVSADGKIAYANPTFERMFGYRPSELDGMHVSVLNAPDGSTPEEAAAEILTTLERQGAWSGEVHNVKKDGTDFWSHAEVSTFEHPQLEEKVWVSVQRDITERKLGEEADRRLRALVEHAGDAILGTTTEGIVTSWNPGSERLYGYSAEEMIGRPISLLFPDGTESEFGDIVASVKLGQPHRTESLRRCKDGSLVWVSVRVFPVKDREGKVVGMSGIHSDITERRRAEEELRKSESQLADAQRVAHIGSWEWDVAANEIHWSDELYRIHGLKSDEFDATYDSFLEWIHPDDRDSVDEVVQKAFADGEPFDYYHRCIRPGGEVRMLHAQGRVERDENGQALRIFGTCQDVTELKRMEAPQRRLAAIIESSEDAIFSKSREGTITSWNPGAMRLFGYEAHEIIGRPMMVIVPPDHRSEEEEIVTSVLAGKGVLNYETQRQRKDHSIVDVAVTVSPIRDGNGMIIGCSSITRDITERKRIQEEADRLKDEFFATVSHELRTPLTSIIGYTDLLLQGEGGELTDQQRRFLEVTERNAKRQLRLVGDMLFVSKAEAGEFSIELGSVDLDGLIAECVEAAMPAAEHRGIEISYRGESTPLCEADGDRIAQLADNLISNAIKFTPEGGRAQVDLLVVDGQAVLEVTNSGSYIAPADQKRLFDRFYRAASASADAVQGVGLGLTIAEAIVHAHGGKIQVRSDEQSGTVFSVWLPLREPSTVIDLASRRQGAAA